MDEKRFEKRINDEIRGVRNVRIIGLEEEPNLVTSYERAMARAASAGLDLIEINPNTEPPICRIYEYSKYLFEEKKKAKEKKQKTSEVKEIRISVNISDHDLETKVSKARGFIADGDKVKVVLEIKGRQLGRREESKTSIYKFIDMSSDFSKPESLPKDEGKKVIVVLRQK